MLSSASEALAFGPEDDEEEEEEKEEDDDDDDVSPTLEASEGGIGNGAALDIPRRRNDGSKVEIAGVEEREEGERGEGA